MIGLSTLKAIALLALLLFGGFGLGALIVQLVGFRDRHLPEFSIYSIALGLGLLSHLMLLFGGLGFLYPALAWGLVGLAMVVGVAELLRHRQEYHRFILDLRMPEKPDWFSIGLALILLLALAYPLLANAFVPPVGYDEAAYHLAVPKIYTREHRVTYIPFIPHSNWPLEMEMLFTLSLLLSSETLSQLVSWAALLLICASLWTYGKKRFDNRTGLLAAVIFASTPMVTTLAGTALIEMPLTLFTLLAVLTMLDFLEEGDSYNWILSALFGGLAASTKLNAALTPLILGLFMASVSVLRRDHLLRDIIKRFLAYGLIALAVVAPWYLKAWWHTGNPFWPFFYSILGGRNWDMTGSRNLLDFIHSVNMPMTVKNWLFGLWRLNADPGQFGPYRVSLGWLYLLLLPLAIPAALFLPRLASRRAIRWLGILALLFYTAWFFQTHQTRFLMPTSAIFALLAASGGTWLLQIVNRRFAIILQSAILIMLLALNWFVSPPLIDHLTLNLRYLTGQVSRDLFLRERIQGYEAFIYANRALPEDATVWMALWESRGYFLDRDYLWANPIGQRIIPLEQIKYADQLADELHAREIDYILFQTANLDDYLDIPGGQQIEELVLSLLKEKATLIFQSGPLELYQLNEHYNFGTGSDS